MKKIVFLPYDMDTAIGINNEGSLTFSYNLEDIDTVEGGADVFNGQQSVLWQNIRAAFFEELRSMYQTLRSRGTLSYEVIEQMFEEHQDKWPEAIFNEDAYFKYLQPLIDDGSGAYLDMLQGSKSEQRKWWLYNRFRYIDSKYNAGDSLSDVIQIRGYAKDNITVTPYADVYPSIKFGSYLVQVRGARNTATTIVCPLDNLNDTEIYIYSASQLSSVGDLSGLKVGFADFSMATHLQNLKLGDSSQSYTNGNLTSLTLGNNELLQTLDVRNCPNLTQPVDISGCKNIEEVYFTGTGITGLTLPNGGILRVLALPASLTNLTIRNQPSLTTFTMPSYSGISTLRLENIGSHVPLDDILSAMAANSRVRLIGFTLEMDDMAAVDDFVDELDTMRGLDEQGGNLDNAVVAGTITGLDYAQDTWVNEIHESYSDLNIEADLMLDTLTITDTGTYTANEGHAYTPVIVDYSGIDINSYVETGKTGDINVSQNIAGYAFRGTRIDSVTCTDTVTSIGTFAFDSCTRLKSVYAPSVTSIGNSAFNGCSSLASIYFPNLSASIASDALCVTALKRIYLPSLMYVGSHAIRYNSSLEELLLPNLRGISASSGTIGQAFNNNPKLRIVDLGLCGGISVNTFASADVAIEILILRKSTAVVSLASGTLNYSNAFKNGGTGGTVYIPEVLYNHLGDGTSLDYKAATNWSTYEGYGTITWEKIEGSEWEI